MGKRIISSLLGVPITFLAAIFVFFILQVGYDLFVGDTNVMRYVILSLSVVGLVVLLVMSLLKKRTVVGILKRQMGG